MTPVSISPLTAEGLKTGKLALDLFSSRPMPPQLIPLLAEPPTCETCGGSFNDFDDIFGRLMGEPVDPTICPTCDGSGYPKDITLVVECEWCKGTGHAPVYERLFPGYAENDPLPCPSQPLEDGQSLADYGVIPCTNGYHPVAQAQLLQVLPVVNADRESVAPLSIARHTNPDQLIARLPEITDISHLLPWFGEGVKWAGLVTGLGAGSST